MKEMAEVLSKCHHRKRLLEYFKLAKKLGLKVENISFSSFILSANRTQINHSFEKILMLDNEQDENWGIVTNL